MWRYGAIEGENFSKMFTNEREECMNNFNKNRSQIKKFIRHSCAQQRKMRAARSVKTRIYYTPDENR